MNIVWEHLIAERTKAGLAAAGARDRRGGRPYVMMPAKVRLAQAAMANRDTSVSALCAELGVKKQTLYSSCQSQGRAAACWV